MPENASYYSGSYQAASEAPEVFPDDGKKKPNENGTYNLRNL